MQNLPNQPDPDEPKGVGDLIDAAIDDYRRTVDRHLNKPSGRYAEARELPASWHPTWCSPNWCEITGPSDDDIRDVGYHRSTPVTIRQACEFSPEITAWLSQVGTETPSEAMTFVMLRFVEPNRLRLGEMDQVATHWLEVPAAAHLAEVIVGLVAKGRAKP